MTHDFSYTNREFDEYAADYDAALAQGLAVSGEGKDFFARARIAWLARCLQALRERPFAVMDFGCGIGSAAPFLTELLNVRSVLGVDVSAAAIEVARRRFGSGQAEFALFDEYEATGRLDLVYCNGVFHHIPPADRAAALNYVYRSLKPGGLFAFWENNPWNPGTRYVMSRIPFDHDAKTLTAPEARRLVRAGGLDVLRTDFFFIFPRALGWCRPVEPLVSRLPLGAQYQVLCRKPLLAGGGQ